MTHSSTLHTCLLLSNRCERLCGEVFNIAVRVFVKLEQNRLNLRLYNRRIEVRDDRLDGPCHIEPNICHIICGHVQHGREHGFGNTIPSYNISKDIHSKQCGHTVKVVRVSAHLQDLGNDGTLSPLSTEGLGETLQIKCGSLTNGVDAITQPCHTQVAELLIEKFDTQLAGQERSVLNDGKTNTPLAIFGQLNDGRQKRLGQKINTNNLVDRVKLGDDVETYFRELVLQKLEEQRKQVLDGAILAQNWSQRHNDRRDSSTNMLGTINSQLLDSRKYFLEDSLLTDGRIQVLAEVGNSEGGSGPNLGFVIFKKTNIGSNHVVLGNFRTNSLLKLGELVCNHVAHTPGLVSCAVAQGGHDKCLGLFS
eukprot:Colp12_sorted_trinity150504_noHs@19184